LIGELRFAVRLFDTRAAQFENHRIRLDNGAGPEHDALDPACRRRRNPADVFRNQRAGPANLAQHLAALDGIDPHGRAVDARSRGLEPGHADGDGADGEQGDCPVDGSANLFLSDDAGRTSNINH
jgi:hypothetical protein